MDKKWFESMFESVNDSNRNDKWGHQYRVTQKIRLEKGFNLIKNHLNNDIKISDVCCGLSNFLNKFKINNLYGFDISQNAINRAKK